MRATQSTAVPAAERQRLPSLVFGPFAFDPERRLLSRDGAELSLPPRVLGVLELLLQRAGDVVPRQEIIDTVWKDAFVTDTSLAEAVSALRQALGDDPQAATYIQTLHRRGYRFVAPVAAGRGDDRERHGRGHAEDLPGTGVSPSIAGQLLPWSTAALCAVLAIAALWQLTRRSQILTAPAARFAFAPVPGTTFDATAPALAISPDGTQLAWSACDPAGCRLYRRPLDRLDAAAVPGTDDGRAPFFSPDSRWLAFFSDGRLKKVALAGGAPVTIADASMPLGGVWIDREIVFAGSPTGGLLRVSADGGEARPLTVPREGDGEVRHAWPSLVPDRRAILFTIETMPLDDGSAMLSQMAVLALDAGSSLPSSGWRTLSGGASLARAAAPDTIVFSRGSELHAMAFDPARLATAGAPRSVHSGVATSHGAAHYALSTTGAIVYATPPAGPREHGLSWWPVAGAQKAPEEIRRLRDAALAPDGSRIAGVIAEGARADIWVTDVQRGAATRLTHTGINLAPVWSADGRQVYFASRGSGPFELWSRPADGSQPARRLVGAPGHVLPLAASPDGTTLAFRRTGDETRADIWALPLGGGTPHPLVQGPFDEHAASFSPDSRLLAFQSAETGRWEIYVRRLADGRRVVVSTDGGERPMWTRDGLYYQARGRLVRAVISDSGGSADLAVQHAPSPTDLPAGALRGIAPDGRLLLDGSTDFSQSIAVVGLEWLREVRSLLGPPASALPR